MSMFMVSKWLGGLLLPPFSLALMILLGLVLGGRWPRARLVAWVGGVLLLLLSMPFFANSWLRAMEFRRPVAAPFADGAQAIVVLGGGSYDWSAEWKSPTLTWLTLQRVQYAAWLHRQTGLPLLVTGGSPNSNRMPEGAAMALVLRRDFGVPVRWIEDRSINTAQNAEFSARLLRGAGVQRVYVVSHAWHLPRALPQFQRAGLDPVGAPTAFTPIAPPNAWGLLPSGHGLFHSYVAAHETVGRFAYFVRDILRDSF